MRATLGAPLMTATAVAKHFEAAGPLRCAHLAARAGTVTLVLGSAGSGKTSLVRCLTGGYRLSAGEVTVAAPGIAEVHLAGADPRSLAWLRTHQIACYDGELVAAPTLPTAAAVARAARTNRPAAEAALARLAAEALAPTPIGRLRAPQRRTAALAAALLSERDVIVLDEPERAAPAAPLADWLTESAARGAAVVVTAAVDSALRPIATAVGHLEEGRIAWA